METKLATAAATGASTAALQQKLAAAKQQQVQLQVQFEAADAARESEAERLEEEDRQLAERQAAAAGEQVLPTVSQPSDKGSSDTGSPSATALVSDLDETKDLQQSKDIELVRAAGSPAEPQKGFKGLLSKLRKQ